MIGARLGGRRTGRSGFQKFSMTGTRVGDLAPTRRRERRYEIGEHINPDSNPAMDFDLPRKSEGHGDYRLRQKPCDDLGDMFVDTDVDEDPKTDWEAEEALVQRRYIESTCKDLCPFTRQCAYDAVAAAQGIAYQCGGTGRLHGVWAGVTFKGNERKSAYARKLGLLFDKATTTEEDNQWEPSSTSLTTPLTQSA